MVVDMVKMHSYFANEGYQVFAGDVSKYFQYYQLYQINVCELKTNFEKTLCFSH